MAESGYQRCQHLDPDTGTHEPVHEGGRVEEKMDKALTFDPAFPEQEAEEELDGVPVIGADDEEWSTETLRSESQKPHGKTQVSSGAPCTTNTLRSGIYHNTDTHRSLHGTDALSSESQHATDMLSNEIQHTSTLWSESQHATHILSTESQLTTDTLKSANQHDTSTLRDSQHAIDLLRSESHHTRDMLSESHYAEDIPSTETQHTTNMLRSESQHTTHTLRSESLHGMDTQRNEIQHAANILRNEGQHVTGTLSSESHHDTVMARTESLHTTDRLMSESQHTADMLRSESCYPRDTLRSESHYATDLLNSETQGTTVMLRSDSQHTADVQRSESQHTTDTQRSESQHTMDTQRSESQHTMDTLRSESQHTTDVQRSESQHTMDTQRSESQPGADIVSTENYYARDVVRSQSQHATDTLRSECQHTSDTQQISSQNATDSPQNVTEQTFDALWSSSPHAVDINESEDTTGALQDNEQTTDRICGKSRHPSDTLQNKSERPMYTLYSNTCHSMDTLQCDDQNSTSVLRTEGEQVTDTQQCDTWNSASTVQSSIPHVVHTLCSDGHQATNIQCCDDRHTVDTLQSSTQHAVDILPSEAQHTAETLLSDAQHAVDVVLSDPRHAADTLLSDPQHATHMLPSSGQPAEDTLHSDTEQAVDTLCSGTHALDLLLCGTQHAVDMLPSGTQNTVDTLPSGTRAVDVLQSVTEDIVDMLESDSEHSTYQQACQLQNEHPATNAGQSLTCTAGTRTDPQCKSAAREGGLDVAECLDGGTQDTGQLTGGMEGTPSEEPVLGLAETYPCVTIKEEETDEEYEHTVVPQPLQRAIKEEPTSPEMFQQHRTLEELRISSVFSVRGSSCSTLSGTAPAPPPGSSHSPPRGAPHVSCSGCSKVLQRGQTAFQRKGSSQLFCSTVCLTGYNLPPAARTPRKTCHRCLQEIGNPKDVISAPVDTVGTLKDFCSQGCLSLFHAASSSGVSITCSVCKKTAIVRHEVSYQGAVHKLCSDSCFSRFRANNKLTMNCCETCGGYCFSGSSPCYMLQIEGATKKFCSQGCAAAYKQRSTKEAPCAHCHSLRSLAAMLEHTTPQGRTQLYCSSRCLNASRHWSSLSGVCFPCHHCHALSIPQYHLPMTDGSLLNFCCYSCVVNFQAVFKVTLQLSGSSSAGGPSASDTSATVSAGSTYCGSINSGRGRSSRPLTRTIGLPLQSASVQGLASSSGLSQAPHQASNFCQGQAPKQARPLFQGQAPVQASPLFQENAPTQAIPSLSQGQALTQAPPLSHGHVPNQALLSQQGQAPNQGATPLHGSVPNQAQPLFQGPAPKKAPVFVHRHAPNQAMPSVAYGHVPTSTTRGVIKLTCKQCHRLFTSKPELFQLKGQMVLFCGKTCSEDFKKANCVMAHCEYCNIDKVVKDVVKFDHVERAFCSEGCKLLYKNDVSKCCGTPCRTCAFCTNMTTKTIHNHFGGKLEEFCQEDCMSRYTVLFYQMARCDQCSRQGRLAESLQWLGNVKYFCDLRCVLHFCFQQLGQDSPVPSLATPGASLTLPTMSTGPPQPTAASFGHSRETGLPSLITQDTTPVIANVVSLASTPMRQPYITANTALQGAVPAVLAPLKSSGDASTQTDAVPPPVAACRKLKNKALQCRPISQNKGVMCKPHMQSTDTQTDDTMGMGMQTDEDKKTELIFLPVPVPIFVPLPLHMYTQYTPVPLGFPLPVPVPLSLIPGADGAVETKNNVPEPVTVQGEERDKPLARGEQGSSCSTDLKSKAVSISTSLAEEALPTVCKSEISVKPKFTSSALLDLEADFPLELRDQRERSMAPRHRGRRRPRDGFPPRKRGRKRAACVVAAGMTRAAMHPTGGSKLHHMYGVNAWRIWVQNRARQLEREQPKLGRRPVALREDVLQCSSAELRYGLCRFVHQVRRPSGEAYSPDSIFYLCLGIQQHLFENGRMENIFTDLFYSRFTLEISRMLKDWRPALLPGGRLQSRVQEEFLWECKQLGAYSPMVLLNTLLFFSTKIFQLKSIVQHRRLSFARISRCTRTTPSGGKMSCLRFQLPRSTRPREVPALPAKRKMIEEEENDEVLEMPENTENPLRCPVRLYEFYLSKCSDSVKQRSDLFYLQPERSCVPSSPLWFSSQPLEGDTLDSMLTRILTVCEVHQGGDEPHAAAPAVSIDGDTSN